MQLGNIYIHSSVYLTKAEFYEAYTGKININIDEAWKAYEKKRPKKVKEVKREGAE